MSIFISQFVVELLTPFGDEPPTPPMEPPTVRTLAFGEGLGTNWWVLWQLTDSGDELRTKEAKAMHLTGRVTSCSAIAYAFDVEQPIDIAAMERGERIYLRNNTRPQHFPNTTEVEQTRRKPIAIVGTLTTMRIAGNDEGQPVRDRIDEAVMEIAQQGVRR